MSWTKQSTQVDLILTLVDLFPSQVDLNQLNLVDSSQLESIFQFRLISKYITQKSTQVNLNQLRNLLESTQADLSRYFNFGSYADISLNQLKSTQSIKVNSENRLESTHSINSTHYLPAELLEHTIDSSSSSTVMNMLLAPSKANFPSEKCIKMGKNFFPWER